MKDTDKVELTVGDIKRGAEKCGTAKEILKELFPEVFRESPPEWEDVTTNCRFKPDITGSPWIVHGALKIAWARIEDYHIRDNNFQFYKFERGRIWRRKSA